MRASRTTAAGTSGYLGDLVEVDGGSGTLRYIVQFNRGAVAQMTGARAAGATSAWRATTY